MLTQGWRKYVWNENIQGGQKKVQVLEDGIHGNIFTIKKRKDAQEQKMIMVFNPENDGNPRLVPLDSSKNFYIGPDFLNMGRRFYIKHFGTEDHKIGLNVTDEFHTINDRDKGYKINYPIPVIEKESSRSVSMFKIKGGIQLEEVSISGKRSKVFRDKYLGQLDSLAKLDINTDYVGGPCGTLNCQVHEFHSDNYKSVEGKTYSQMMGFKWTNNRSAYTITGHQRVKYTYPQYTEAEILEKFNLLKVKGYYGEKEFYSPQFENYEDTFPDYRNTLFWASEVVTDKDGKTSVEFFTSDINTTFLGILEGVSSEGLLGNEEFSFFVTKGKN